MDNIRQAASFGLHGPHRSRAVSAAEQHVPLRADAPALRVPKRVTFALDHATNAADHHVRRRSERCPVSRNTTASVKPKHSLRARFTAAFVCASRKLLLNRIFDRWNSAYGAGNFHECRAQSAATLLKTSAREAQAIVTALDAPSRWHSNEKQYQSTKWQLSERHRNKHFGNGRLSIDQRAMLYSLPQMKAAITQLNKDFSYDQRPANSSRKLLLARAVKAVQALDDKAELAAKLVIDTYMQRETHAACAEELRALLASEVVGRLLEITVGLNDAQQRAAALDEIEAVCAQVARSNTVDKRLAFDAAEARSAALMAPAENTLYDHLNFKL